MSDWVHASDVWLCASSPVQQEVLWFNDVHPPETARPPGCSVPDVWHEIDLSNVVPEGTVAVALGGILLITSDGGPVTDTIKVWIGKTDQIGEEDYYGQATTVATGERQCFVVIVPLTPDRKFKFKWSRTDSGAYPAGPAYGIRLWLLMFWTEGAGAMPAGQKKLYRNQPSEGWDTPSFANPVSWSER